MSKAKIKKKVKVLMTSAEVAPFAKVGGLADVAGSLPIALKKLTCDVRMIMPLYAGIDKKKYKLEKIHEGIDIPSGLNFVKVDIWKAKLPGSSVIVYFVDCPKFFGKGDVYSGNNSEKFLFFSMAALYVTPIIKFVPDVVHCHDSHTAMIPDIIKASDYEFLQNIKTVYTIHNFRYQGKTGEQVLSTGNLKKTSLNSLTVDAADGDINYTVQGFLNADIINTVSRKYSHEILTPYYGEGLDKLLATRKKSLYGIVNGIDMKFFNPATDKFIAKNYSVKNIDRKLDNKLYLQSKVGLPIDASIPLVGIVTRLVSQKGLELVTEKFAKLNCQFVFLGTGQKKYEDQVKKLAKKYPEKFSANIMFDMGLAQEIYAGSDMFLMPSLFEPCGLGQMIAMRYGTLPVVRATGGLDDTVDEKVGFKFEKMNSTALYGKLKEAIEVFVDNPKEWKNIQVRAMKKDFSWDKSAKAYLKLYEKLAK